LLAVDVGYSRQKMQNLTKVIIITLKMLRKNCKLFNFRSAITSNLAPPVKKCLPSPVQVTISSSYIFDCNSTWFVPCWVEKFGADAGHLKERMRSGLGSKIAHYAYIW